MRRRRGSRHLTTALRWPLGLLATWWAYLWRITPLHRDEVEGEAERDAPPPFPARASREAVQVPEDGHGAYMRRRYRVEIEDAELGAAELIAAIREDPNRVVPAGLARFHKEGEDGPLAEGDEYTVRMPGPWDGPVRVIEATADGFRFATLEGHLEAGQIAWRASERDGAVRFEVESWSRPGDRFSSFAHHHLRAAKEVQLHMWTSVLERVTKLARGRMRHGIEVRTYIVG